MYWQQKSIAGGVLAAVNLVLSILIYLPFVKVATIQERRKEALDVINQNGEQVIVFRFYITIVVIANFHKDLYNFVNVLF